MKSVVETKEKPSAKVGTIAQATPGPWQLDCEMIFINRDGQQPAIAITSNNAKPNPYFLDSLEECFANARLIAAAPELLEAAKEALGELMSDGRTNRSSYGVEKLEIAIAKAEGRAS